MCIGGDSLHFLPDKFIRYKLILKSRRHTKTSFLSLSIISKKIRIMSKKSLQLDHPSQVLHHVVPYLACTTAWRLEKARVSSHMQRHLQMFLSAHIGLNEGEPPCDVSNDRQW